MPDNTLRLRCGKCNRESRLPAKSILLSINEQNAEKSYYRFKCSHCYEYNRVPADKRTINIIKDSGVKIEYQKTANSGDPPINHDDLIDFHFILEEDNWFEKLLDSLEDSS